MEKKDVIFWYSVCFVLLLCSHAFAVVSPECDTSGSSIDASSDLDEAIIYAHNCVAEDSTISNSLLNSTSVEDSTLTSVRAIDSLISDSTLVDIHTNFSTIEDSNFGCGNFSVLGAVQNNVLSSGKIVRNDLFYYAPFQIDAICAGVLPITGTLAATPPTVTNGSYMTFEFFSSATVGLNISVNTVSLNLTSAYLELFDDGTFPDTIANDGIYTGSTFSKNDSDATMIVSSHVLDNRGNNITFNASLTIDNTQPSVSLIISDDVNTTSSRAVDLAYQYSDLNGITGCRASNYNLNELLLRCPYEQNFNCEQVIPGVKGMLNPHDPSNPAIPTYDFSTFISGYGLDSFGFDNGSNTPANPFYNISESGFNRDQGTIEMWVRPDWDGASQPNVFFFGADDISTGQGFIVWALSLGTLSVSAITPTVFYNLSYDISSWTPNSVHHIAVTYENISANNHVLQLFIDGALVNSTNTMPDFPLNINTLAVGGRTDSSFWANATIDEFMVFGYPKTVDEIAEDYNQPTKYVFTPCVGTQPWLLSNATGNKTVWFQAKDSSGNIGTANDTIVLTLFGDTTSPEDLEVSVEGNYTQYTNKLLGRWNAFDAESDVFYRYQIYNATLAITGEFLASNNGRSEEALVTGLSLVHNESYRFFVTAYNFNSLETTGYSPFITIDTQAPTQPAINSTTHLNTSWSNAQDITANLDATDSLSNIAGYSYVLDTSASTNADEVADVAIGTIQNFWNYTENPESGSSELEGIAVDSEGNVWVAGWVDANWRMFLQKYDENGNLLVNYSSDPTLTVKSFIGVDVGSDNAPVAAGRVQVSGNSEFYLTKLDANGAFLWNWSYNPSGGSDEFLGVTMGSGDIIYGVGYDEVNGDEQMHVIAVNSTGSFLWNWTYNPSANDDRLYDAAVDSSGNIVVVGFDLSAGAADHQMHVIKLNATGSVLWNWTYNPSVGNDALYGVAIDSNDYIVVAGGDSSPGGADRLTHVIRLSSAGAFQWNWTHNPTASIDLFLDIAVDSSDNIIAAGGALPTSLEFYVVKLTSSGTQTWNYTSTPGGGHALVNDVTTRSDTIYITGYDTVEGDTQFHTQKISSQGDQRFHTDADIVYPTTNDGQYYLHARAVDHAGNWGQTAHYQIRLDASAPSTPQFTSDDATQGTAQLELKWTTSTDATSGVIGYHLRVDDDSDFSSPQLEQFIGNTTEYTASMPANGTWYAAVRAENNASLNSTWSNQVSKIIDQIPPTITSLKPVSGGEIIVNNQPTFIATTNEPATCTYTLPPDTTQYTMAFTGTYYHESTHPNQLANGAGQNVDFSCTDAIGNTNTTGNQVFEIDTTRTVSTVTWTDSRDTYTGTVTNGTILVQDGGANGLSGIDPESFVLAIAGVTIQQLGVRDIGDGVYELVFTAPAVPGQYKLVLFVDGILATGGPVIEVNEAKLYVNFHGIMGTSNSVRNHMIYGESTVATIGMATDTKTLQSNISSSPPYIGSDISQDVYLFLTGASSEADKKEKFLENQELLDQPVPAFGEKNEPDEFTIVTTLEYPSIIFDTTKTITTGRHNLVVKYGGVYSSGPNKDKINMSIILT